MVTMLADAPKLNGTHHDKTVSPETTLETFRARCRKAGLSILKETRRIDNGRLGIPVYFSVCGHDANCLTGTRKQMGKGVTPALAEASAVMELAERFSLYSFLDAPSNFTRATYDQIKEKAISFDAILKSVHDPFVLPEAVSFSLFSSLTFKWAQALDITRNRPVLIPMDWFFMISEFNGSSAGNCNEEAICQGICELIERHVSSVIANERPELYHIRLDSITDEANKEMIRRYHREGIRLYINDFSMDTGVPTIGILAWDPNTFPDKSEIVWTAGTAPDPEKALSRALTEVAQLAGDFNSGSNYVASGLPKFTRLEEARFITEPMDSGRPKLRSLQELPNVSSNNIRQEIMTMTGALDRLGYGVYTIQTTDSRLDIPAFYTIIPGTRFRERAENSSVAMFAAKHAVETLPPGQAFEALDIMDGLCPGMYFISFYQGTCLLSLGQPEKALDRLARAHRENPASQDIPSICSYSGHCLKEMGRYEEAINILDEGLLLDSDREDIHNLKGFCFFMLKEHEKSIECFEEVLRLNPGSAIDHASLGSNYRELGNIPKAVHHYEMAVMLDPSLEFARKNLVKLVDRND